MKLQDAADNIGRGVVYRPYPGAVPEQGVITSVNHRYVFVHYTGDMAPKATRADTLEWMTDG